jgi:hypothetical protein
LDLVDERSLAYRARNTLERPVGLLRWNRTVAARYDKRAAILDGTVDAASIRVRLREPTRESGSQSNTAFCTSSGPSNRSVSAVSRLSIRPLLAPLLFASDTRSSLLAG